MKNFSYNEVDHYETLKALLIGSAEKYSNLPAFKQKEDKKITTYTYKQFKEDVFSFGTILKNYNLLGKHIAIIGETSYEWICAYFAISCGGGVVVPLDKEATPDEVREVLVEGNCTAFIYSKTYDEIMAQPFMKDLSCIEDYVCLSGNYKDWLLEGKQAIEEGDNSYEQIVIDPKKMSAILYTSGTTGKSKGVMLTNESIMAAATGALQILEVGDTCLSVLPVHHSYEFTHGIVMMLIQGVCICINDSLRFFVQNLNLFRPTHICIVPLFVEMMYKKILNSAKEAGIEEKLKLAVKKSNDLLKNGIDKRPEFFADILQAFGGRLNTILCGGSPLSANLMRSMREFGIMVVNGYGITECSPLVAVSSKRAFKDGSVGLPIGCNEVKITNLDEEGNGDIWVKGKNVMLGYYKNEQATKEAIVENWFNTGDIGKIDDEGFLFITGRRKNIIVLSNGKNIYPEDVEEYYLKIPYIKEIVVYSPVKAELMETTLCAEVFIDENFSKEHSKIKLNAMLKKDAAKINKNMPAYKQVHQFNIRDNEFEKTTKKSIKRFTI